MWPTNLGGVMTATRRSLRLRTKIALILSAVLVLITVTSFTTTIYGLFDHCAITIGYGGTVFSPRTEGRRNGFKIKEASPIIFWLPWIQTDTIGSTNPTTRMFLPMWMIAPFVFIPTFLLWRKDRRTPEGHCPNCDYDLTGNVSGKCSECGVTI